METLMQRLVVAPTRWEMLGGRETRIGMRAAEKILGWNEPKKWI
jgi:hypothetical protein